MSLNTYLLKPVYKDKITPENIHVAYSKFGHNSNKHGKMGKTDKVVIHIIRLCFFILSFKCIEYNFIL